MSQEDPEVLFSRYKQQGIIIDTGLMLLYLIGSFKTELISNFKRTAKYRLKEYRIVLRVIDYFDRVITTPNILTEVSNLSRQLPNHYHAEYFAEVARVIRGLEERYTPSAELASTSLFDKLGLTDAGIVKTAPGRFLVLTDDFPLANRLSSLNIDVVNFNHLRFN